MPAIWNSTYNIYCSWLGEEELKAYDEELAGRIVLGGKLGDPVKDLVPVMLSGSFSGA